MIKVDNVDVYGFEAAIIRFEMSFADKSIKIDNNVFMDILEAFNSAKLNLKARHECEVCNLCLDWENNSVTGVITLLDGLSTDEFKIGNHLRGVSQYLCKKWPDKYKKVGSRLFNYRRITGDKLKRKDLEDAIVSLFLQLGKDFMSTMIPLVEKAYDVIPDLSNEDINAMFDKGAKEVVKALTVSQ